MINRGYCPSRLRWEGRDSKHPESCRGSKLHPSTDRAARSRPAGNRAAAPRAATQSHLNATLARVKRCPVPSKHAWRSHPHPVCTTRERSGAANCRPPRACTPCVPAPHPRTLHARHAARRPSGARGASRCYQPRGRSERRTLPACGGRRSLRQEQERRDAGVAERRAYACVMRARGQSELRAAVALTHACGRRLRSRKRLT